MRGLLVSTRPPSRSDRVRIPCTAFEFDWVRHLRRVGLAFNAADAVVAAAVQPINVSDPVAARQPSWPG